MTQDSLRCTTAPEFLSSVESTEVTKMRMPKVHGSCWRLIAERKEATGTDCDQDSDARRTCTGVY